MAFGTFSSARIGAMTWGPAHDVWSASIAISQINMGLSGGLAYKEVEQAITSEVTAKKSLWDVMDDKTQSLLSDPATVTRGFRAAAAVSKARVEIPSSKGGYISNWCEDLGYADFYNLAFRLFGFNAFSTHWLYFSFLICAFALFVLTYYRDRLALASLNLGITALFLTSSSGIFTATLPAFAANRFLSTLGLIPVLYIIHAVMRRRPFERVELAILAGQILMLDFVIAARSSGKWTLVALILFSLFVVIWRTRRTGAAQEKLGRLKNAVRRVSLVPYINRVGMVVILVFVTTISLGAVRNALTDERYFWDDNLPHHLFWHSAYVGLGRHPDWRKAKPYAEIPDGSDGMAFKLFEILMKEKGLSPVTTQEGVSLRYYRARLYEPMIREQYLTFIRLHPRYMFELFTYYKPVEFYTTVTSMIRSIGGASLLLAGISIVFAAMLYASLMRLADIREIAAGFTLIWLCSLLPNAWAYSAPDVMADQVWSSIFVILAIMVFCLMFLIRKFLLQRFWDDSAITSTVRH